MATKDKFDFNCPQYVNFLDGIDNSDDVFFDCCDHSSPLDQRANRNLPVSNEIMTDEVEDRLVNKMTAALSVIENTPKLKASTLRGKLFSAKAPVKIANIAHVKPIVKPSTLHKLSARIRSKSVCELNKVHTDKPDKAKEVRRKRSSSVTDLRTLKKHTFPKTPLCLKRTMKAKTKVFKTTEQLELEQIAELQKELSQLLRNNEISYKKLRLKQGLCIKKNAESKPENTKVNAGINADKNTRRNFHALSHTAMKRETLKLDCIINDEESSEKALKYLHKDVEKWRNCSVSSITSEECDKNKSQVFKKPGSVKLAFHSGLVFHETKKNTVVKPFSFDTKTKEGKIQNAVTNQTAEVSLTKSVSKHVSDGKENIPVTKPKSVVKRITDVQNIRKDIKLLGSHKKIGERHGNPVRSFPFAENSSRN